MSHQWKQFTDGTDKLLRDYWTYLRPHEMNFSTISFIVHSHWISIDHDTRSILVKGSLSGEDVVAVYGHGQVEITSVIDKGIIISNFALKKTLLNQIRYSLIDLKKNWLQVCSESLRRQIKNAISVKKELFIFDPDSPEWKKTLQNIHKFLFLKEIGFPLEFLLKSRENLRWFCDHLLVGKIRVEDEYDIHFLMTRLGNVLSADFHFTSTGVLDKKINLTTVLHHEMLNLAREEGMDYYHLGILDSNSFSNFEGVKRYKNMWRGEEFSHYLYKR